MLALLLAVAAFAADSRYRALDYFWHQDSAAIAAEEALPRSFEVTQKTEIMDGNNQPSGLFVVELLSNQNESYGALVEDATMFHSVRIGDQFGGWKTANGYRVIGLETRSQTARYTSVALLGLLALVCFVSGIRKQRKQRSEATSGS